MGTAVLSVKKNEMQTKSLDDAMAVVALACPDRKGASFVGVRGRLGGVGGVWNPGIIL